MRSAIPHLTAHPPMARFVLPVLLLLVACAPRAPVPRAPERLPAMRTLAPAQPSTVGMSRALNARLDSIVQAGIAGGATPGAALAVGRYGRLVYLRGSGRLDWAAGAAPVTDSTIYDLASLTKVVATTTAAMLLEDEGRLGLDRPVSSYLPGLNAADKAAITVRQILTHTGGFEAFAPLYKEFRGREQYLEQINARPLAYAPGTKTVYSDWDFILMQLVIEQITGKPLDRFVEERIFRPLGMRDTGFRPGSSRRARIAPTEVQPFRGGLLRGVVHDENAWAIGGVAGHAGLFSSARDLAIFAQMLLNGGEYGGVRILQPATVARWTARQNAGSSRALGWDTPAGTSSAGRYFSPRSFGHTGFTGTSIWIDPERSVFVVLLTNRVNPTRDNKKVAPLRRAVADAVQESILDAPLIDWEARR